MVESEIQIRRTTVFFDFWNLEAWTEDFVFAPLSLGRKEKRKQDVRTSMEGKGSR